jgi:hypothetical protein
MAAVHSSVAICHTAEQASAGGFGVQRESVGHARGCEMGSPVLPTLQESILAAFERVRIQVHRCMSLC